MKNKPKLTLNQIRQKHKLSLILLHGSKVTGNTHNQSDTDIAILQKNSNHKLQLLNLLNDLQTTLGTIKVDITNLSRANPLLLFAVTKKARLLSGKNSDFKKLQLKAFHRYCNYQKFFTLEKDYINHKLKSYVTA